MSSSAFAAENVEMASGESGGWEPWPWVLGNPSALESELEEGGDDAAPIVVGLQHWFPQVEVIDQLFRREFSDGDTAEMTQKAL
ncbi:hypothetical protein [Rariglobus hedericola]|uniref:Uncharacterized protein n=1 Tax=Rariglobus hedericola TaxID=2597822 RepID=A0A556QP33_9BACT|nr:hypothetical protein [Rariglobus hedericola]TSJ78404.1 hypothetical protein FPL22_03645 [Rariglobus hedericola]